MAQPPFSTVLCSPVSENLRGALVNSSLGAKGEEDPGSTTQSKSPSLRSSWVCSSSEPASLTRGCAERSLSFLITKRNGTLKWVLLNSCSFLRQIKIAPACLALGGRHQRALVEPLGGHLILSPLPSHPAQPPYSCPSAIRDPSEAGVARGSVLVWGVYPHTPADSLALMLRDS